jgi:hypothetical protein
MLVREAFTVKGEAGEGIIEQIDGAVEIKGDVYLVEMKCEFSAINRLIAAEEGVPVERRYSFPVGIFTREVKGPLFEFGSWERPTSRAGPPRTRYCLSHFPLPRATSKPIGPRRARISFCAGARFVSRIPLSVTVAGANRLMMHTTIGSGFAAAFAADAARRSRSCRHSRRPTAITA